MSKSAFETVSEGHYRVSGVLDAASAPELLRESEERIASTQGSDVHIDLSGVTESDSSGLALLLEWLRVARQRKQTVHFANVPVQIVALARISEVEELIVPDTGDERKRA